MNDAQTEAEEGPGGESAELRRLRAERSRLVAEREKRDADKAEAAELERLKREIIDEQAIAKAECEIGELDKEIKAVYSRGCGVVIVKRPLHAHYRQMIDAVGHGKMPLSQINERFAFQCLVYPSRDEFEQILKKESGLLERVADAAARLGGLVVSEAGGK